MLTIGAPINQRSRHECWVSCTVFVVTPRKESRISGGGSIVYDDSGGAHFKPSSGIDYTAALDDDSPWEVSVHLEVVGGRLVVTDLRVSQRRFRRRNAPPPEGGITSRILRSVRVAELVEEARAAGRRQSKPAGGSRALRGADPVAQLLDAHERAMAQIGKSKGGVTGRRRHRDEEYLAWAAAYVACLADGSTTPIAELARKYGVSRDTVRDRIHVARTRKLLTDVPEGARIGGELTDKARAMLAEPQEDG
jgi:hypothetical protein